MFHVASFFCQIIKFISDSLLYNRGTVTLLVVEKIKVHNAGPVLLHVVCCNTCSYKLDSIYKQAKVKLVLAVFGTSLTCEVAGRRSCIREKNWSHIKHVCFVIIICSCLIFLIKICLVK